MPRPTFSQQLQLEILKKRGLVRKKRRGLSQDSISIDRADRSKTLAMKLIEERFGRPIEELLEDGTGIKQIGERLGIDPSTVSVWRLRLGLRERLDAYA